jgi:hypothetical protein
MASLLVNTGQLPSKYRSMSQSPRPQANGAGGPPRRNWSGEPPTPDEPKNVWGEPSAAAGRPQRAAMSRRASFLKFLSDNPNVAQKRTERNERMADGAYQTTIRRERADVQQQPPPPPPPPRAVPEPQPAQGRDRAPSPFHISYGMSASDASSSASASASAYAPAARHHPSASLYNDIYDRRNNGLVSDSNVSGVGMSASPAAAAFPPAPAPVSAYEHNNFSTAAQLFYSMDSNSDGLISWSEFLGYLNQSEARNGVHQARSRRSSMGNGFNASTKLQRRLALRKFFNTLDVSGDGYVSLVELCEGLDLNPQIKCFFDSMSLQAVNTHSSSTVF